MATIGQVLLDSEDGWKRYDNKDPYFIYHSSFNVSGTGSSSYKGSSLATNVNGATVSFHFIGSKMRIITRRSANQTASVKVSINGSEEIISFNGPDANQVLVYEKLNLPNQRHTVVITNMQAAWMEWDAIDIDFDGEMETVLGTKMVSPQEGWKRIDPNNEELIKKNSWASGIDSNYYNGSSLYTGDATKPLSFRFKGTRLRIISMINPDRGQVTISINGNSETYNAYGVGNQFQMLVYEKTGLTDEYHNVIIQKVSGTYVDVDAIDIDDSGYLVPLIGSRLVSPELGWKRYDDIDSAIQYSPGYLSWSLIGTTGLNYKTTPRYTGDPNARITFDFIGTKIRLIQRTYPGDNRSGQIEIDGKTESFVSTIDQYQTLVYEKTGLENKRHSVTITWLNDNKYSNAMDAIDIDSSGRLLHPDEIINLNDLEVGKRLRANYQVSTSNQVGSFSKLGEETGDFIPIASSATPNGDFYFIMVQDKNGKKTLVADRNIQHSISWNVLNEEGIASGSGLPIDFDMEDSLFTIRLLTGGITSTDKDSEWDKWVGSSSLAGTIAPGDNNIWNWQGIYSWTSSTTASGVATNRSGRGLGGIQGFYNAASQVTAAALGFRPVLEIESNFILKNYSFIYEDHMYKKYVNITEGDMVEDTSYSADGSLLRFSLNKYAKNLEVK